MRPVRVRVNSASSTGTGVSSVCTALEVNITCFMRSHTGLTSSAQAPIQSHIVWRDNSTPWRRKIPSNRYSGR